MQKIRCLIKINKKETVPGYVVGFTSIYNDPIAIVYYDDDPVLDWVDVNKVTILEED